MFRAREGQLALFSFDFSSPRKISIWAIKLQVCRTPSSLLAPESAAEHDGLRPSRRFELELTDFPPSLSHP